MTANAIVPTTGQRVELPLEYRLAPISNVNEQARTVDVTWTTGASVRRRDWFTGDEWDEVLVVDANAVDLSRLNGGAPVLNAHQRWDLDGVLAVVERAWIEGAKGMATLRFPAAGLRAKADEILALIRDRIIQNVSVGYSTDKAEWDRSMTPPQRKAVRWTPHEISFVPVGADAGAGTRSTDRLFACELIERAGPAMEDGDMTTQEVAREVREQIIGAERTRARTIRERIRASGLPDSVADTHVASGVAVEHLNPIIADELAARGGSQTPIRTPPGGIQVGETYDSPERVMDRASTALAARMTARLPRPLQVEMTAESRAFAGLPLLELGAEVMRANGVRVPHYQSRAQLYDLVVVRAYHTGSDFPLLLADSMNKALMQQWTLAPPKYLAIATRKIMPDFRPRSHLRAGDFPLPLLVNEHGEFKSGTMGESGNSLTALTYGRIIGLTRQVLINDDLNVFGDLTLAAINRSRDFVNATGFQLFSLNSGGGPTVDGAALWHASHGNLAASGSAIDLTSVGAGRAAMMKQVTVGPDPLKLNYEPRFLLTSPDKYTIAEQFVATNLAPTQFADANPFAGKLTAIGDANLSGNAWYLFADPAIAETFVYGYLEGFEGPQFQTKEGWKIDGVEFKLRIDLAVGALDYRGAYKNPGA